MSEQKFFTLTRSQEVWIPANVKISDLNCDGMNYDIAPLQKIQEANGFKIQLDNITGELDALIALWYDLHIQNGGDRDFKVESLISESGGTRCLIENQPKIQNPMTVFSGGDVLHQANG